MAQHGFIEARPAPAAERGVVAWARRALIADRRSALATASLVALALWWLPGLVDWALLSAVFRPDAEACQAARGAGACWGAIAEKHRLIVFGRYPAAEQWRPLVASALLMALLTGSCWRRLWRPWWPAVVVAGLAGYLALMHGGVAGLSVVTTDLWGGLPLTLLLASLSIALAFPLAIAVALGRRSDMPAIRSLCTVYVELVRGVPLISVLFMASFMFPLFMPQGVKIDVLVRVLVGITLFAAAYLAEIVRGGLQAVPAGQVEAAQALGLGYWRRQRLVVLPQALATVLPGLVNSFIGIFKDTSLVTVVSLYELTGAHSLAFADVDWRPFQIEGYLFVAAIYFGFCFALSRFSLAMEQRLRRSAR